MASHPHLYIRENANGNCTQATCPVSDSVYGYRPNLGVTIFFLLLFTFSGIAYAIVGFTTKKTTKFFTFAMLLGSFSEVLGYVAKMLLWQNPFSQTGFKMSIVLLTFAPAFYAGGIYYTLKYICLTFGASFSRLRPAWYTWIFISCDVLSIALQAVGGALSSASTDLAILNVGTDIMIAGLSTQVVTQFVFGVFAADYAFAVYRHRHELNAATEPLRKTLRFKLFIVALWVAYFGILIRCAYRVAELSGGWTNNPIIKSEWLFVGLDSVPIGIAAVVLNIWHPGYCFPKEYRDAAKNVQKDEKEGSLEEKSLA